MAHFETMHHDLVTWTIEFSTWNLTNHLLVTMVTWVFRFAGAFGSP